LFSRIGRFEIKDGPKDSIGQHRLLDPDPSRRFDNNARINEASA
jgi:hypothetical protein